MIVHVFKSLCLLAQKKVKMPESEHNSVFLCCATSGSSPVTSGDGHTAERATGATLLNAAFEDDATRWLILVQF